MAGVCNFTSGQWLVTRLSVPYLKGPAGERPRNSQLEYSMRVVREVAVGIICFVAGWINLVKSHCPQSVKSLLLLFPRYSIGYAQPLFGCLFPGPAVKLH